MKSFILQIFACFLLPINYFVLFIFRNASLGDILELTLKLLVLDFVLPVVYPWHYYLFIIFLMFIRTSGLLLTNYIIIFLLMFSTVMLMFDPIRFFMLLLIFNKIQSLNWSDRLSSNFTLWVLYLGVQQVLPSWHVLWLYMDLSIFLFGPFVVDRITSIINFMFSTDLKASIYYVHKFFWKTNIYFLVIRTPTYTYQG